MAPERKAGSGERERKGMCEDFFVMGQKNGYFEFCFRIKLIYLDLG
jgi:hypothetical protein